MKSSLPAVLVGCLVACQLLLSTLQPCLARPDGGDKNENDAEAHSLASSDTGGGDRWAVFKDLALKLTGAMRKHESNDNALKHLAPGEKSVGGFVYDAVITIFNFIVELAVELVRIYSPALGETLHTAVVKTNLFAAVSRLALT